MRNAGALDICWRIEVSISVSIWRFTGKSVLAREACGSL